MALVPRQRNRVEYRIDLGAPENIEQVKLVRNFPGMYGKRAAILFRYGRAVAGFILSDAQLRKLKTRGDGTLTITSKQIDMYDHYAQPYGRDPAKRSDAFVVHVRFDNGQRAYAEFPAASPRAARQIAKNWRLSDWIRQASQQGVNASRARRYQVVEVEPV